MNCDFLMDWNLVKREGKILSSSTRSHIQKLIQFLLQFVPKIRGRGGSNFLKRKLSHRLCRHSHHYYHQYQHNYCHKHNHRYHHYHIVIIIVAIITNTFIITTITDTVIVTSIKTTTAIVIITTAIVTSITIIIIRVNIIDAERIFLSASVVCYILSAVSLCRSLPNVELWASRPTRCMCESENESRAVLRRK